VQADAVQIQQVVLNLVRNSIDAMVTVPEVRREIVLRTHLDAEGDVEFMVRIAAPASKLRRWPSCSILFSPRSPVALGSGCRSAVRSCALTAASCGAAPIRAAAHVSSSRCRLFRHQQGVSNEGPYQ
jgi:hypothetical protein